jgi:hypothetical protein
MIGGRHLPGGKSEKVMPLGMRRRCNVPVRARLGAATAPVVGCLYWTPEIGRFFGDF